MKNLMKCICFFLVFAMLGCSIGAKSVRLDDPSGPEAVEPAPAPAQDSDTARIEGPRPPEALPDISIPSPEPLSGWSAAARETPPPQPAPPPARPSTAPAFAPAQPAPAKEAEPQAPRETPVFGKFILTETVNGLPMPVNDQDASIYLGLSGTKKVYKIHSSDAGDFGVYLPEGTYRVLNVKTNGYKFIPEEMYLNVPAGQRALYAGTVVLDGRPTGVMPGSVSGNVVSGVKKLFGASDTFFAYSVKDEQKDLEAQVRRAAPEAYVRFAKSLFYPRGGIASGRYPDKVFRAKDVRDTLFAGSEAAENWVGGTLISLPYIISPVWLFTLPFD